jgi:hypothetical protein
MALTRPAGSNQSNLYGRSQWLSGFYSPVDQHTLNEAYAIAYAAYRESDPEVRKILKEQILDFLDSLVADDEQRGHSDAWRRRPPRGGCGPSPTPRPRKRNKRPLPLAPDGDE